MIINDLTILSEKLIPVIYKAGDAIMDIYHQQGNAVTMKADGSPVTQADLAAEAIIIPALQQYAPNIPIISEENTQSHDLKPSEAFFLVDPLDGTKEFIKYDGINGNEGSFTVNIGLIHQQSPIMGLVYAPAMKRLFVGIIGDKTQNNTAYEINNGQKRSIAVRPVNKNNITAVASKSHRDAQTDQWLAKHNITNIISISSSLKFCLIALGEADVYPRFAPTSEWDTAAADAVLRAAGGILHDANGNIFTYGKLSYRNGHFIAYGDVSMFI